MGLELAVYLSHHYDRSRNLILHNFYFHANVGGRSRGWIPKPCPMNQTGSDIFGLDILQFTLKKKKSSVKKSRSVFFYSDLLYCPYITSPLGPIHP